MEETKIDDLSKSPKTIDSAAINNDDIKEIEETKIKSEDDINKYFRGLHNIKSSIPFKIGYYTMIYGECLITFKKHDDKNFTSFGFDSQSFVCEIGSDVIIYPNVKIFGGVNIGHGSRLLEGSVITNDVKPYSIVDNLGNVKSRFSDEIIDSLLKLEWWNLPYDIILKHKDLLSSDNTQLIIDGFLSKKEIEK
jgi:acetyltransferase-like isoleucine patch superfamily enzyme